MGGLHDDAVTFALMGARHLCDLRLSRRFAGFFSKDEILAAAFSHAAK